MGAAQKKTFLVDGPLVLTIERRRDTIEQMAQHLIRSGENLTCDRDAVRVLLAKGYPTIDVALLAGEARMVAFQDIVAREMAKR